MQPKIDSPINISANTVMKSDEKTEFLADFTAFKTQDQQIEVENYNDDLFEQFSDLKSKLRSGKRSILNSSNRSTFRCRTSTEMFGNLIENGANQTNNSIKILSEGFYDNDFLLNDFIMASDDLPQALLET
jgi:hypothetical protein